MNKKVGGILDRLFLHATRPGSNPGGATPKGELENLDGFRFEADIYICLSWTFSVTQSKGHSGLAAFYGTGFGTCGYNDKQ